MPQPFCVMTATSPLPLTATDAGMRLLLVLLLISINGFFVAAEFSIVSVRRSRINQLVSAGDVQAKTVQDLQRSIERLLSTTQLGITLSSLALGWIGESTMATLLVRSMAASPLPSPISYFLSHSIAVPLAFLLIAYLQIVLGELCPKAVAMLYAEQISRFLGTPSLAIARIFNPFIWILNQSTRWLLRLVGIQYTGQVWSNRLTPEELHLIINTSAESPGLEAEERQLLSNVFEFGEVTAGEVMVPRTSIVELPKDATFRTLLGEVAESGHSRYPVTGESLDDVCGVIYFKELAEPLAQGRLTLDSSIQDWIRPARFVPEYTPLNELLHLMQRSGQAMVMVVDEFGGTAGLLTLQDVINEIIGDPPERESSEDPEMQIVDDRTVLVQAQMDLEEVNDLLNFDLPFTEEYQTLGGFIIYHLQKIPPQGETFIYGNLEFTICSAEGPRLHHVQIRRLDLSVPDELIEDHSPQESDRSSSDSTHLAGLDEDSSSF
ncbi:MAG: HlyC/CorC family transporter [Leptolyngbya sp. DLM2.Bin15]|nr:MAG: HlyC/CorC family transporter [Leptolyngbya sp. DLM2.Bin15]